jgi:hypothetical protein
MQYASPHLRKTRTEVVPDLFQRVMPEVVKWNSQTFPQSLALQEIRKVFETCEDYI